MMTLDFYFKLTGYLLYPGQAEIYRGQCVQSVMIKIKEVDGVEPPVYPEAKDYWNRGIPGYEPVSTPQRGDIVVYDGHGAFPEGHIAIVADGQVFEQNADPLGSPVHMYPRSNTYLLGYLRKGEIMPTDAQIDQWISLFHQEAYGSPPTDAVFADWRNVLKNNFVEGSLSIMQGTDTNAGALKNQPSTFTTLSKGKYEVK